MAKTKTNEPSWDDIARRIVAEVNSVDEGRTIEAYIVNAMLLALWEERTRDKWVWLVNAHRGWEMLDADSDEVKNAFRNLVRKGYLYGRTRERTRYYGFKFGSS